MARVESQHLLGARRDLGERRFARRAIVRARVTGDDDRRGPRDRVAVPFEESA